MTAKKGFSDGNIYHCSNLGIDKKLVFNDEKDLNRFTQTLAYYRFKNPPARFSFRKRGAYQQHEKLSPLVEVIAYSMMPNHFHLLLKQVEENGISRFISKITNSYTKYFNSRNSRSGSLFSGTFKSSDKLTPEQTLQVSSYIHNEPVKKGLVIHIERFPFSSYREYMGMQEGFCEKKEIMGNFTQPSEYHTYILQNKNPDLGMKNLFLE